MTGSRLEAKNLGMEFSLVAGAGGLSAAFHMRKTKLMALENLNFILEPGDKVGVLGNNGAGKSTLLKILSGVLRPSHGLINSRGAKISLLDLNTDIIPQASCIQNIHLRGYSLGLKRSEIIDFEKYARANADLEKFIHSPVSVLSTGMKTRLLVSMIGYHESDILIMDEWIGTADTSFYEKSTSVLNRLVERSEIFILASHNRRIIEQLCNKVLVLSKGKLIYIGNVNAGFDAIDKACEQWN